MATLTKAQLAARVLQQLGVLGIGDTATAADTALVEEAIDAAHDELRKEGLAPFALATIPMWAQLPLRDFVSGEVGAHFGKAVDKEAIQFAARRRLAAQTAGYRHSIPILADYF